MVIFDQIDRLQFMKYDLYSSNLFYTNVTISTALRGRGNVIPVYKNLGLYIQLGLKRTFSMGVNVGRVATGSQPYYTPVSLSIHTT